MTRLPPLPPLPLLPGGGDGKRGVALLAVLWMLAGAGTAVALGLTVVRDGVATSRYRGESTRSRWMAEGCLAEFRATLEEALVSPPLSALSAFSAVANDPWMEPQSAIPSGCPITVAPPPEGPVDVNAAPDSVLRRLPGFDDEVVDVMLRQRALGRRFENLDQLIVALPWDVRDRVAARYADLVGRVAFAPPLWVVAAGGVAAGRAVPVATERWVRVGNRVAVVRRELW